MNTSGIINEGFLLVLKDITHVIAGLKVGLTKTLRSRSSRSERSEEERLPRF